MNANELADFIKTISEYTEFNNRPHVQQCFVETQQMLHQQQSEIKALKAKELTNEEISDIRDQFFAPDGCNIYTFARALLKKANEI
jgi:CRISPR/Cas system Type II protein with McrA/HNH and RuvC-like nuclease domain